MPPGRKTHHFPDGKPLALWALDLVCLGSFFAWMVYSNGSLTHLRDWLGGIVILAVYGVARSQLLKYYERNGSAVPLPWKNEIPAKRIGPLPRPLVLLRWAFILILGGMLSLQLTSVSDRAKQNGVIACVLLFMGIAITYVIVESYYEKRGPK